jgi:hypothetical protein
LHCTTFTEVSVSGVTERMGGGVTERSDRPDAEEAGDAGTVVAVVLPVRP